VIPVIPVILVILVSLGVPAPGGPLAGVIPPGFTGHVNVTVPAATVLNLADRPGELGEIGPVDPDPGANTQDRYRSGHQWTLGYLPHQRAGPLPGGVGDWCASPH